MRIAKRAVASPRARPRGAAFPPPSCRRRVFDTTWGRDREGGIAEHCWSGFPPPLTPPHKGEGDTSRKSRGDAANDASSGGIECLLEGRGAEAGVGGEERLRCA